MKTLFLSLIPPLPGPVIGNWRQKAWKSKAEKKWLTDVAMVCLIGPTHPPSPASNGINHVFSSKKLDQILFSPEKKSRENVKSVRFQWLSFSTAKKRLRGVFSDLSKSKKCHKCCGFFNISFTVICKTKSLIRLDCVPHHATQFLSSPLHFILILRCNWSLQLLIFCIIRGKAVEFLALLHA